MRAKAGAEQANISKTKFLAAASHDILQPLNAARLYVTSLIERQGNGEASELVGNIDASLEAVEEIFGALLDISRLDTGVMKQIQLGKEPTRIARIGNRVYVSLRNERAVIVLEEMIHRARRLETAGFADDPGRNAGDRGVMRHRFEHH